MPVRIVGMIVEYAGRSELPIWKGTCLDHAPFGEARPAAWRGPARHRSGVGYFAGCPKSGRSSEPALVLPLALPFPRAGPSSGTTRPPLK